MNYTLAEPETLHDEIRSLARRRAEQAVALRHAGATFKAIARKLGLYDGSHARRVYLRGLAAQARGEQ